jgi:DNA modification methylase
VSADLRTCPHCGGYGEIRWLAAPPDPQTEESAECPECRGEGVRGVTPYLSDPDLTLYVGDALDVIAALPAESVDCCMTSPPYYGLRDYGTATWEGGDPGCDHLMPSGGGTAASGLARYENGMTQEAIEAHVERRRMAYREVCARCGARRVDRQIGLESTPEEYVARLVEVFREVRRVLAPHGTCWLNLGDSYASGAKGSGAKPKDLLLMPARVALALQDDGWWVRSDVIWSKPNPMPESVTDRPTRSHEYLFLLTKSARYWWDAEAVAEPITTKRSPSRKAKATGVGHAALRPNGTPYDGQGVKRNVRSVWTIATVPYPDAHFATFPEELARRAILAGCPERVCATCGEASRRVVDRVDTGRRQKMADEWATHEGGHGSFHRNGREKGAAGVPVMATVTTGWTDCGHNAYRPGVVLDPFMGSGTVALVARKLGRRAVGIELNPEYAEMVARRTRQLSLLGGAA